MSDDHVSEALKVAALKAGMVDLDGLKLADMSKMTLEQGPYGVTVRGADAVIHSLKERWPDLFSKHARHMSEAEMAAWWKDHARKFPGGAPRPEPLDLTRKAKDMSPAEREAFLKECARRFG
jgi:hypothetical protein